MGAIEAFAPIYSDGSVSDSRNENWDGTDRKLEKYNIPSHQGVLGRRVVTPMNRNELFLCSISESDGVKEASGTNTTYHRSDAENSSNEERGASSEFFLERIAQPCSSVALVRVKC